MVWFVFFLVKQLKKILRKLGVLGKCFEMKPIIRTHIFSSQKGSCPYYKQEILSLTDSALLIRSPSYLDLEEGMSEMSGIVCYSQYIFLNKDLPGDAPGGCYNLAFTCVHTREVRHTSTFGSRHWSWGRTRRKILARICHVRIAGLIISIFSNDLHKSHPDTFGCRFIPRHVALTRKAL